MYENKSINQINLFDESIDQNDNELLENTKDFIFEERLSKEFDSIGFFISDHPLNQFKDFFPQYNVIDFNDYNANESLKESLIAATILKIQEKKNQKV